MQKRIVKGINWHMGKLVFFVWVSFLLYIHMCIYIYICSILNISYGYIYSTPQTYPKKFTMLQLNFILSDFKVK